MAELRRRHAQSSCPLMGSAFQVGLWDAVEHQADRVLIGGGMGSGIGKMLASGLLDRESSTPKLLRRR